MPTSHTTLTIYNRALDLISEFPVSTPLDSSNYARWLNRNFAPTVEGALRQQPWNFACRFYEPNLEPTAPLMRWRYAYGLPNGWLRVLQPTRDGLRTGEPVRFAVQGNYVLTNEKLYKGLELVMNIQNPGEWDALFADFVAARLGTGMAQRFTGKNSYVDRCKQLADEAYQQAEMVNAFEGSIDQPEEYDIIRHRGGDDSGRWRY